MLLLSFLFVYLTSQRIISPISIRADFTSEAQFYENSYLHCVVWCRCGSFSCLMAISKTFFGSALIHFTIAHNQTEWESFFTINFSLIFPIHSSKYKQTHAHTFNNGHFAAAPVLGSHTAKTMYKSRQMNRFVIAFANQLSPVSSSDIRPMREEKKTTKNCHKRMALINLKHLSNRHARHTPGQYEC